MKVLGRNVYLNKKLNWALWLNIQIWNVNSSIKHGICIFFTYTGCTGS